MYVVSMQYICIHMYEIPYYTSTYLLYRLACELPNHHSISSSSLTHLKPLGYQKQRNHTDHTDMSIPTLTANVDSDGVISGVISPWSCISGRTSRAQSSIHEARW